MGNIYKGVAKALRSENAFDGEYPNMNDGVRGMLFIEKVVESNKNGKCMGTSRQSMKTVKGPGIFLAQFVDNKAPFNSLEGMVNGLQI